MKLIPANLIQLWQGKYHATTAAAIVLAMELGSIRLKVTAQMKEDIKFLSIKDDAL